MARGIVVGALLVVRASVTVDILALLVWLQNAAKWKRSKWLKIAATLDG
jgi:hypothetical protein